jgi:hypothetical protein
MRTPDFERYALATCTLLAMLADCGGSQPPITAPGAMLRTSAIKNAHRAYQVLDAA